jgi:AsmA-like C-terminal region
VRRGGRDPGVCREPKLLPLLLHREIEIRSIELSRPSVEFVRNKNGTWNFATLASGTNKDGRPVSIDRLKIDDGQIVVTDLHQKEPRTVYDHIDLLLHDFGSDKNFPIEGRAHVSGTGQQTIVFHGNAGPIQRDGMVRTPFDGKVELNEVSLAELQRLFNVAALADSDSVLTGRAQIKNDQGFVTSNGQLEARTARFRGVDFGVPITVRYNIKGDLTKETLQIETADLNLGKTPIAVQGTVPLRKGGPVELNVTTAHASLSEAARLAAAFGVAFSADTKADGVLDLNVHARGPSDKLVMDGTAAARNLQVSGGDLRQPVRVDKIELSLSPATIQSNEFTATTGGTKVQAQFTLSGYASDTPVINARISSPNGQVEELLNIAHAYGISAVEGVKGSGAVQLNVAVAGPIGQTDKLTYSGNGGLRNAIFNLTSLSKPLGVRNADLQFSGNSIVLNNVDLSIGETVARGNLTLHNPADPRVEFSLAAEKINVPEWQALTAQNRPSGNSLIGRMTGSGRVSVNTVLYDDLVLSNVDSTVKLDNGLITMSPLTAGMYGGQEVGTVVLNARTEPVTYSVNLKLQDVDANRILSAISPVKDGLYGRVSANANTKFTGSGGARSIARTLDGRISLNLHDGAIANMDLLHQMAAMAQFLQMGKLVDPVTKVGELSGDFDIKNGVAQTNNLKGSFDAGSFAATGTIDLEQQKLNLRMTPVLSKEYSDAVGGTEIGGYLTTAVANQNGEIVVPMVITGTFQDPEFAPDLQKVAEMKLQQIVPGGLLKGILRGKPGEQEEQDKRNDIPDVLDRIFGGIGKKR